MKNEDFDVIIVGGGVTGAGTARDCALRGLKTLLLERNDIATGATGRNHGLLHSGARYAVADSESARECIIENSIIKRIAPHCVDKTGGLFITLPQDVDAGYGLDYQAKFIQSCRDAGIHAKAIDPAQARMIEPAVNPDIIGAVKVPDASVDPFRLCACNVQDARDHGATVLTYTSITRLLKEGDRITGVQAKGSGGVSLEFRAPVTVLAAGIWSHGLLAQVGIDIEMVASKGSLLVFGHRMSRMVINRCRKSADADILVPGEPVSILGTTSTKVPFEDCDRLRVTREEVELLLREGSALCPELAQTRIIRAYAGVRPLVSTGSSGSDGGGRGASRGIVCLDHEARDGVKGLITITGGKLTTYRLMAEIATDEVCRKLGVKRHCTTATKRLPDIVGRLSRNLKPGRPKPLREDDMVCQCERVGLADIHYAVQELGVKNLEDLRRRTRAGMGTCQGTFCTFRTADALCAELGTPHEAPRLAREYVNERWKGMMPVGWGDTLREMEFMQRVYKEGRPYSYEV
ncbi:MAG: anaerobic glycerol-3-phosphate dehydrogenase subunit A [Bacteroidales bacterium]|nr:anaerobic glycerol-3-phosphate dehydrogenase subunit A [Bacteroidales bacterium]